MAAKSGDENLTPDMVEQEMARQGLSVIVCDPQSV